MIHLDIDENRSFKTHAEVLNEVFHQKARAGNDYVLAVKSVWPLDDGGYVCFFPLAEETEDGAGGFPKAWTRTAG
jgi:hypothetical protein